MNPPVPLPLGARRVLPGHEGVRLSDLRPGARAEIRGVSGAGVLRRRLLEMGFVSGTPIRVVRVAPFADPIEVELHGYHLSLRRADAATVLVDER